MSKAYLVTKFFKNKQTYKAITLVYSAIQHQFTNRLNTSAKQRGRSGIYPKLQHHNPWNELDAKNVNVQTYRRSFPQIRNQKHHQQKQYQQ